MLSYKVKNLYIGILGYVTRNKDDNLLIERRNEVIIYQKNKCDYSDYCAKEIFTNQKYYFFQGNWSNYNTIYKSINDYAIFSSIPLSMFSKKDWIPKKELIKIQEGLKNYLDEKNKESETTKITITDSILQMILETSTKIKEAYIEEELKKQILKDLEDLGEYYVNEIINKINSKSGINLNIDNEYTIKMEIMRRLVEIEDLSQNPNTEKAYSLKKQLSQFRKNVK